MKSITHLFAVSALLFLFQTAYSHKQPERNQLERLNLKTHHTIRTLSGAHLEKNGLIRYRYNLKIDAYSGSPETIARAYLQDWSEQYGFDKDLKTLQTERISRTPGGTHIRFEQTVDGVPVFGSRVTVSLNQWDEITFVSSAYRLRARLSSPKASLEKSDAIQKAFEYIRPEGPLTVPQTARLMIFESRDRGFELAWKVNFSTSEPGAAWEIFINAQDGRIIHVQDKMMYHTGEGLVWDPDPLTTAGTEYGGAYTDNNDLDSPELNAERITVILPDITYENGLYRLEGPYAVLADLENPSDNFPELADSSAFVFTRNQQNFEAVMCYYHVDRSTRRMVELGYEEPLQMAFKVDPHGLNGDDNSHYDPNGNYVAFGEGGVDDAEDADAIWHEHAHSFQTNLTGGMAYTGETMSLQEGSSDYWAASYSRYINDYNWGFVFSWDGHNEFWNGRRCDLDWVYPDDYVSGHSGGQIWSSALMKIWVDIGRDITDQLFLETHYIWGYAPGLQDAAEAFIQADRNLYDGAHTGIIVEHFDAHGLVNKEDYIPEIVHTPLSDTEDTENDYPVIATIFPGAEPLDPERLWVIYGLSALTDTVNMSATTNPNEYVGYIPATGVDTTVYYYITAVDEANTAAYDPANAPLEYHEFVVGADTLNPVIQHTPLGDQPLSRWPATVRAIVTDNLSVDSVECIYYINTAGTEETFTLDSIDTDTYEAVFPVSSTDLTIGDSIFYRITATDASTNENTTTTPDSGYHAFEIIDEKGTILIVNDDPLGKTYVESKKGGRYRKQDAFGKSSDRMQSWLEEMGYIADQLTVTDALTAEFTAYDLIISSSGANESPVANADYRTKLENWVSDPSHKLLVEGGEVGYDAAQSPGYPSFAANVLHSTDWDADQAGPLLLRGEFEDHPIATTPNPLPGNIGLTYSNYGDQDSQKPDAPAYVVFGNSTANNRDNAGVLVYDDDADSTSAQIVYFAFNLDAVDSLHARNLLENTVTHLLNSESLMPSGAISGTVDLTDTMDDSGVSVYLGGLINDTTVTDSDGFYMFSNLEDGAYNVTVSHIGYWSADSSIENISVSSDTVAGMDFTLEPVISDLTAKGGRALPAAFGLTQNYPNPFNPVTRIRYQLPQSSHVLLEVFNTLGKRVAVLADAAQPAGYYSLTWIARDEQGNRLPSGIYVYRLRAGNFNQIRKLVLVK